MGCNKTLNLWVEFQDRIFVWGGGDDTLKQSIKKKNYFRSPSHNI